MRNSLRVFVLFAALSLFLSIPVVFAKTAKDKKESQADVSNITQAKIEDEAPVEYDPANFKLRDPFLSPFEPIEVEGKKPKPEKKLSEPPKQEVVLPALLIQGMFWDSPQPLALIENKLLRVGDTIKDVRILGISKEGIDVIYSDKLFTISPRSLINREGKFDKS